MTLYQHDPDIEELLGAYALDAVDEPERSLVERHIAVCPRCTAELREHREVAALLSSGIDAAPETVWAGIEDEISPPQNVIPLRTPSRLPAWLAMVASFATFALVAAVFVQSGRVEQLSEQVAAEQQQLDDLTQIIGSDPLTAAVEAAIAAPDSKILTLTATDAAGAGDVQIVLTADGVGFVLGDELPTLSDQQTYQLWAVTDGRIVSAGLFGDDVDDGTFRVDLDGLEALAITPEIAGGVVVSDQAAVAVASIDG